MQIVLHTFLWHINSTYIADWPYLIWWNMLRVHEWPKWSRSFFYSHLCNDNPNNGLLRWPDMELSQNNCHTTGICTHTVFFENKPISEPSSKAAQIFLQRKSPLIKWSVLEKTLWSMVVITERIQIEWQQLILRQIGLQMGIFGMCSYLCFHFRFTIRSCPV